jgi:hypothetical protein
LIAEGDVGPAAIIADDSHAVGSAKDGEASEQVN